MKILSVILYNDEATIATIAGNEYSMSKFLIFSVPNVNGNPFFSISLSLSKISRKITKKEANSALKKP
jgi:hypothetical protein